MLGQTDERTDGQVDERTGFVDDYRYGEMTRWKDGRNYGVTPTRRYIWMTQLLLCICVEFSKVATFTSLPRTPNPLFKL